MVEKMKVSPFAEKPSTKPSATRRGEAQTAAQLFKMFGMNIPYAGNLEEDYEFDSSSDAVDSMFDSNRNDIVDHREVLDLMEQEFINHSSQPVDNPQPVPSVDNTQSVQPVDTPQQSVAD